jgi:ATP adenylyltransferase
MPGSDPEDLLAAAEAAVERAHRRGALVRLATEPHLAAEGGIPFVVRLAPALARKKRARGRQAESRSNPFLPYDEDLFVAALSPDHVCLLNRFAVLEPHLLVVTRNFQPQDAPLEADDFAALGRCLAAIDGVGFFNSGPRAGASQPHKHLQLVPPLGEGPGRAPLEAVLGRARRDGDTFRVPGLPFDHALARLQSASAGGGQAAASACRTLLRSLFPGDEPGPYNLLVTRDWMLAAPRRRGAWQGVEVNALGFAGSLLVRSVEQLAAVRRVGPMAVLRAVGRPPGRPSTAPPR